MIRKTLQYTLLSLLSGFFLLGSAFGISLEFDDAVLTHFPCLEIGHYDARFSVTGNNFDGIVFWSGAKDLGTTGVTLQIGETNACPWAQCAQEEIVCHKQVQGLYYNKERGERLRPLDPITQSTLEIYGTGYTGFTDLSGNFHEFFTGGWFTDCEGANTTPKHIYGQIIHSWSGETYHMYAGMPLNIPMNSLVYDATGFANNMQFLNSSGDYAYIARDLRGYMFDTYGGIATFDDMMACFLPGDNFLVPHASQVHAFFHNDPLSLDPILYGVDRLCFNGTLSGDPRFRFSTPLDCILEKDQTIVPHGTSLTGWFHNASNQRHPHMDYEVRTCFDGYLSGDVRYGYSQPLPCYMEGDGTYIAHGTGMTGYRYNHTGFNVTLTGERRACRDGFLSGSTSYKYSSYINDLPRDCRLSGHNVVVPHDTGITGYQYFAVGFGQGGLCTGERRTCRDGTLSGTSSYQYNSCTVLEPQACALPRGGQVAHSGTVVAYAQATVRAGQSCLAQTRSCANSVLSGTYQNQTCTIVPLDQTAEYISCAHVENVNRSISISTPSYTITGLTAGYSGAITITTGTLFVNNVNVNKSSFVKNGDVISVTLQSASTYDTDVNTTLRIGDMYTMCSVHTKKEYTTFSGVLETPVLTTNQKYHIWKTYNAMLDTYEEDGSNMCSITQSLLVVIGKSLFEINKTIIATSDNEIRHNAYFKKLILEYLIEITKAYKEKITIDITRDVNGIPMLYEMKGCTAITKLGTGAKEHTVDKETDAILYHNGIYGFHLKFPVTRQDLYIHTSVPTTKTGQVYTISFGLPLQKDMFTLNVYTQDAWKKLPSGANNTYLGENEYYVLGYTVAKTFVQYIKDEEEDDIDDILDSFWMDT